MTAVTQYFIHMKGAYTCELTAAVCLHTIPAQDQARLKNLSMDCEVAHELSSPSWKLLTCDGCWGLESTFSSVMQPLPREPTLAPADGLMPSTGSCWWDLWVQKEAHEFG